jgi:hypothetical protein
MRALAVIVVLAVIVAAAVAWGLQQSPGVDPASSFASIMFLTLVGVAITAMAWRRQGFGGESAGRIVLYLAIWGALIAGTTLLVQAFSG